MRASFLLAVPVIALVLGACSAAAPPSDPGGSAEPERTAQTSSAIINGQADTTHQAVVAIVLQSGSQGGLCSGTIVKTDPVSHIGWVALAAHCVDLPPVYVLQGDDFSQSNVLRYDVIDYKADSRYGGQVGSPYDFAVLRIAGVDASTPTIPLASASDGLAVGTSVVSVGYGRTSLISSGAASENTVRRRVSKQLGQVGQMIAYGMSSNGICQGDSGGPVLVGSPGSEKVVGIHSYVQGDCNGTGVSGRVSFGLSFLSDELAKAVPTEDCDLCGKIANSGNGTCAAATRSCLADKQCGGYYECLSSGATKASCLAKFPKAEGPFNAAANCQCTQACTTQCKGTFECIQTPKCGYKLPAGACSTCTEGGVLRRVARLRLRRHVLRVLEDEGRRAGVRDERGTQGDGDVRCVEVQGRVRRQRPRHGRGPGRGSRRRPCGRRGARRLRRHDDHDHVRLRDGAVAELASVRPRRSCARSAPRAPSPQVGRGA